MLGFREPTPGSWQKARCIKGCVSVVKCVLLGWLLAPLVFKLFSRSNDISIITTSIELFVAYSVWDILEGGGRHCNQKIQSAALFFSETSVRMRWISANILPCCHLWITSIEDERYTAFCERLEAPPKAALSAGPLLCHTDQTTFCIPQPVYCWWQFANKIKAKLSLLVQIAAIPKMTRAIHMDDTSLLPTASILTHKHNNNKYYKMIFYWKWFLSKRCFSYIL